MNSLKFTPNHVLNYIVSENLQPGSHIASKMLADYFKVSRSPVNQALALLESKGVLKRIPNRGYFLDNRIEANNDHLIEELHSEYPDIVRKTYYQIVNDVLEGDLPIEVTESMLKSRYKITSTQLRSLLNQISTEGWIEKKPGYGWQFSSILTSPDSILHSLRVRIALEPAALLEPGYSMSIDKLEICRRNELSLMRCSNTADIGDLWYKQGIAFHAALMAASSNPFYLDIIDRLNSVHRIMALRIEKTKAELIERCRMHLKILDLIAQEEYVQAAAELKQMLEDMLVSYEQRLLM